MDTILVTGGCGYIGTHTCVSLLENDYNVLIIDSLVNSFKDAFDQIKKIFVEKGIDIDKRIQFIEGDLRDKLLLDSVFSNFCKANKPIKSVIHFAGLKSIYFSIKSPIEYWDTNVSSTISLILVMKKYQCFSLIFSSSASVYGSQGFKLLSETDDIKPTTPYGKTKFCIEEILNDLYASDKNWRIANLRYFNPVGSHNSGLLRENPKENSPNLFPAILKTIMGQQKEFLIYGNDWPTNDGTCIRDFIHIMDLADAHIATLNYLEENNPQNITINIGTAKGTSVLSVIKTFQEIKRVNFPYTFVERRLGDQPFVVADNKLALKLLNWLPKRSLIDMCNDSVIDLK